MRYKTLDIETSETDWRPFRHLVERFIDVLLITESDLLTMLSEEGDEFVKVLSVKFERRQLFNSWSRSRNHRRGILTFSLSSTDLIERSEHTHASS